jgi:hypothetical protein
MDIYDVTYLRTFERCKYETVHITTYRRTLKSINIEAAASGSPQIIEVK